MKYKAMQHCRTPHSSVFLTCMDSLSEAHTLAANLQILTALCLEGL